MFYKNNCKYNSFKGKTIIHKTFGIAFLKIMPVQLFLG